MSADGRIKAVYGEVDGLTDEAQHIIARIRDQIIPDVDKRWKSVMQTFQGDASETFNDVTRDFYNRLHALEASMARLNGKISSVVGTSGEVQALDGRLSKLFQ